MAEAAYKYGDEWVDELCKYLDGNRKILDATIARIPGVKSMELEATYLSWIDFSGTGMCKADYIDRVQKQAQIASSHGDTFGTGGETFLRFNFFSTKHSYSLSPENNYVTSCHIDWRHGSDTSYSRWRRR